MVPRAQESEETEYKESMVAQRRVPVDASVAGG